MLVLGIESSCDETSVALIKNGNTVLANVVASQVKDHRPFGGVVPELASRKHLGNIEPVLQRALEQAGRELRDIDLIAVTQGPGLNGSLLIGLSFARALAYSLNIPVIGVNHIEAHLISPIIENPQIKFPFISLVVSGGHTELYEVKKIGHYKLLGHTIDDAVGEAYDKVAKLLDLGYPGGPILDKLAKKGNGKAVSFPRGMLHSKNLNFSFSGLKTAVLYHVQKYSSLKKVPVEDVAASFQEAVVDVLVAKMKKAAEKKKAKTIAMAGGVACNSRLRERLSQLAEQQGWQFFYPSPIMCTDNAAMIAALAHHQQTASKLAQDTSLQLESRPNWSVV